MKSAEMAQSHVISNCGGPRNLAVVGFSRYSRYTWPRALEPRWPRSKAWRDLGVCKKLTTLTQAGCGYWTLGFHISRRSSAILLIIQQWPETCFLTTWY